MFHARAGTRRKLDDPSRLVSPPTVNEITVSILRGSAQKTEADRRFFEKLRRRRTEDLNGRGGNCE